MMNPIAKNVLAAILGFIVGFADEAARATYEYRVGSALHSIGLEPSEDNRLQSILTRPDGYQWEFDVVSDHC